MNILGSTFLGADYSYSPTPTNVDRISKLVLHQGNYDTVFISNDTEKEHTFDIDTTWDYNTILSAPFDTDFNAGNLKYTVNNTSDMIIKRREKGTFEWTAIYRQEITAIEDFNIVFLDYFTKNNTTYEYACIGIQKNGMEGNYSIHEMHSSFWGLFICDKDKIYGTQFDIGACDTSRIHHLTKKEMTSNRYPYSYSNSGTNYETGSTSGYFLKIDTVNNKFYPEDSLTYRKELTDFLSDNKPKILKHEDGRIWLINIDGEITNSMDGHYLHQITEFNWYESGDYNSEKDLYDSGLSNVSKAFWCKE